MNFFQRIHDSMQSRIIRPRMQQQYEKTVDGKRIKEFKDKYVGRRCFFIGNGPSLKAEDLAMLHNHGEVTFAFNRIYNIFDQTPWRPTYYISQDEKMLQGCQDIVDNLELPVKFIPIQLKWYHGIDIHDAIYFNVNWQKLDNLSDYLFSDDAAHEIYCASTGMYSAAQLAVYMGFQQIYLIGVDHHFRISQNNKGEIVVDEKAQDYFTEKYNQDKQNLYIPNTEKSTLTYIAMKEHCSQRNIQVYNATRGGKLEIFPRVDLDVLF